MKMEPRFVFPIPESFKLNIAIVSLSFKLDFNNLEIVWNDDHEKKVRNILMKINNTNTKFIVFPEYSYTPKLEDIFSNYSYQNDVVIIGGSATEIVDKGYYAYSPIFFPDKTIRKVYKKRITADENALSAYRILSYPNTTTREFQYEINDKTIKFSVFICNDFLQESHPDIDKRNDIYFVPQFEKNANLFINQAYIFSTEISSYVLGANISKKDYRSIGTSILNSTVVNALSAKGFRLPNYTNNKGPEHYDKSIIYDNEDERILLFSIDLGIPYSIATGNSQAIPSPNVYPIDSIRI